MSIRDSVLSTNSPFAASVRVKNPVTVSAVQSLERFAELGSAARVSNLADLLQQLL